MQNFARRLMSGASFAVLAVGALPVATARASAGRTINSHVTTVTVPSTKLPDFILVTTGGDVENDITNNGVVAVAGTSKFGISVTGGKVEGNILNNNQIEVVQATDFGNGIVIGKSGTVSGNITNAAHILVHPAGSATQAAHGILVEESGHFKGHVINSGSLVVIATGAEAEGVLINEAGTADEGFNEGVNEPSGPHRKIQVLSKAGLNGKATAIGYDDEVTGAINRGFQNLGQMSVTAEANAAGASVLATGVKLKNATAPLHAAGFASVSNQGVIDVRGVATATTGDGKAHVRGVNIQVHGGGGTADDSVEAHAHLNNTGLVAASAIALAKEAGDTRHITAQATGVYLSAGGGHTVVADATNGVGDEPSAERGDLIDETRGIYAAASAKGFDNVHARATGLRMHVSAGTSGENKFHNFAGVSASARADGTSHVTATARGLVQRESSVAHASNTVSNHVFGFIKGHATVLGTFAKANARGVVQFNDDVAAFTNKVNNSSEIGAGAGAFGFNSAHADATAVRQAGFGTNSAGPEGEPPFAQNFLDNNGFVFADAIAQAGPNGIDNAQATAHAVEQRLANVASGKNQVMNHTSIVAFASAFDEFHTGVANATGVEQHIFHDRVKAVNTVENFAKIHAVAGIGANGFIGMTSSEGADLFDGTANAVGVYQSVVKAAAGSVHQHVSNIGQFVTSDFNYAAGGPKADPEASTTFVHASIEATALAKADNAYAHATAVKQVAKSGEGATFAENRVDNTGLISAFAVAHGEHSAQATARGVVQSANGAADAGTDEVPSQVNIVHNQGIIHAFASVERAFGGTEDEPASVLETGGAHATAVRQHMNGGSGINFVNNAFTNLCTTQDTCVVSEVVHAGVIGHDATSVHRTSDFRPVIDGQATARADFATAKAVGIAQTASELGRASNLVYNTGFISAEARAFGKEEATATATGVKQNLNRMGLGFNQVWNSHQVFAFASATAKMSDEKASAKALGVSQVATRLGTATNDVFNDFLIQAHAVARGDTAKAVATGVHQHGNFAGEVFNTVTNVGTIEATATAHGRAFGSAVAHGVDQGVTRGGQGENFVYNTSNTEAQIKAHASASATAGGANAAAIGVHQNNSHVHFAFNSVSNVGSIVATATAFGQDGKAGAAADAVGVGQHGSADSAVNLVFNSGVIKGDAYAHSTHSGAFAGADGVLQDVNGLSDQAIFNGVFNSFEITGSAHASGPDEAQAFGRGVEQTAEGHEGQGFNGVLNHGHISAVAHATGNRTARAFATGVGQFATGSGAFTIDILDDAHVAHANLSSRSHRSHFPTSISGLTPGIASGDAAGNFVVNSGMIVANATAKATGANDTQKATAVAMGVHQSVAVHGVGDLGVDFVSNNGFITAHASAIASGHVDKVEAKAEAIGVYQQFKTNAADEQVDATVINNVSIKATAFASARGTDGVTRDASALAVGAVADGRVHELQLNYVNNGSIHAVATAVIGGNFDGFSANAAAVGFAARNQGTAAEIKGTISNGDEGLIYARATAIDGFARAGGIGIQAQQFVGNIKNFGHVTAIAHGNEASAAAIFFLPGGTGSADAVGHVTNDGGHLFANEILSDGSQPGWAINEAFAPNEVDIALEGNGGRTGVLHGNIAIQAEDTITVENGKTIFDGTITPEVLVSQGNNNVLPLLGTLDIASGGTFEMVDADDTNPTFSNFSFWGLNAGAFVNKFTQEGTLEIDVGPEATDTPTITANTVVLGGTVAVLPGVGLYPIGADSLTYRVVFGPHDDTAWDNVESASLSPLFEFSASYPSDSEADISMTVLPFQSPLGLGLTPNEKATGKGLTDGYNTDLTGNAALLYEAMFQVPASEYTGVLDELYDAQAGELALINSNAARDFIDSIVDRLGGLSQSGGMSLGSLMVNPVQIGTGLMANAVPGASQGNAPLDPHFWASGFGSWTNTKTTISGPGFTTGNGGVALGYDTQVDSNWTLGLAGSYTAKSTVNFEPFGISPVGDRGTYTGFEVGPYARYDSDQGFYLTGAAAYGNFNDRTMRFVTLPNPTPPPTDLSGVVSGKFTTNTWSVYGEGGVPLNTGMGFKMTPFVAVSYIQTDSGAYTETGTLTGGTMPVNLHVSDASATSIETYLGAEFAGTWDMGDTQLLPSLKVAWAHEFDSDIWQVDSYFAAVGPTSAFTVTGSALAKDFAVVDASLGLALQDNLSATLSYEGRYSDSSVSHLVMGKLQLSVP